MQILPEKVQPLSPKNTSVAGTWDPWGIHNGCPMCLSIYLPIYLPIYIYNHITLLVSISKGFGFYTNDKDFGVFYNYLYTSYTYVHIIYIYIV